MANYTNAVPDGLKVGDTITITNTNGINLTLPSGSYRVRARGAGGGRGANSTSGTVYIGGDGGKGGLAQGEFSLEIAESILFRAGVGGTNPSNNTNQPGVDGGASYMARGGMIVLSAGGGKGGTPATTGGDGTDGAYAHTSLSSTPISVPGLLRSSVSINTLDNQTNTVGGGMQGGTGALSGSAGDLLVTVLELAQQIQVKDSGTWKLLMSVKVKNGGAWVEPLQTFVKENGAWKGL